MTGQPPIGVTWDRYVDTHLEGLRREMENRIDGLRVQMDERFAAQIAATNAYAASNQHALEKVNEFRQAVTDREARFATFDVVKVSDARSIAHYEEVQRRLNAIEQAMASRAGTLAQLSGDQVGILARLSQFEQVSAEHMGRALQSEKTAKLVVAFGGLALVALQVLLHVMWAAPK